MCINLSQVSEDWNCFVSDSTINIFGFSKGEQIVTGWIHIEEYNMKYNVTAASDTLPLEGNLLGTYSFSSSF